MADTDSEWIHFPPVPPLEALNESVSRRGWLRGRMTDAESEFWAIRNQRELMNGKWLGIVPKPWQRDGGEER